MKHKNDLPLVVYRYHQLSARDEFIHSFENDFEILVCESDSEAQLALEKHGPKISAFVLEENTHHSSLLDLSKTFSPQSLRILLQKDIPIDLVVSLLEQRAIDKCFTKPYDCNVIRSEIYAAHMGVYTKAQDSAPSEQVEGCFYVLIVDDETRATQYLNKQLIRLNCPCKILIASDATEALLLFRQYRDSLAIIISDQRMPGMQGNQLLTEIRHHNPNIIRILTSAYEEVDIALNAVNEGQIFRYIKKPWNAQEMCACIETALTVYLSKRWQMDKQHTLLTSQFQEIISKRKQALTASLDTTLNAFSGPNSLPFFFTCLEGINTLPATKSALRASNETSLEAELVSAFSQHILTRLSFLSKRTSSTDTELMTNTRLAIFRAFSGDANNTKGQPVDGEKQDPISTELINALQTLLTSSGLSFKSLDFKHTKGCYTVKTKTDSAIAIFKHLLSPLSRLTQQIIEQQSAMLMIVLIVKRLGGDIAIQGGEQKISLSISFADRPSQQALAHDQAR